MEHFMTSEEIAELLHVDPVTIRRLVNKSELSAYRIGADYRFAPSDLQDYLRRQHIVAAAQSEATVDANDSLWRFVQLLRKALRGKHTTPEQLLNNFDRFTRQARHVLVLAQEEAQGFQHNYIGTEHLLLGLLREEEDVAAQVLRKLGIEVDEIRRSIDLIVGRGKHVMPGELALTPRTKEIFELAANEAHQLNHSLIGTGHLLLGLAREGRGLAAEILKSSGFQMEQIRAETLLALRPGQEGEEEESAVQPVPSAAATLLAEGESGLSCASCGAHCPDYFRYCFNCGRLLDRREAADQGDSQD